MIYGVRQLWNYRTPENKIHSIQRFRNPYPLMPGSDSVCISYARVSSGKQRREGVGLERQLERAQEYASANGLTLDDRLAFQDAGKSGSKGDHIAKGAALHQILEAARQGLLGPSPTLLIEDVSRLSRLELMDGLDKVLFPLIRAGCRIVLLEDGSVFDEARINADSTAMIVLCLKFQAAADYARKLKEYGLKHRAKNRQQILDGQPVCPGWAPSWIEQRDGQWQFSAKAPAVQRLIELLWTVGTQTASQTLNREGHKAPKGGHWTQGAVRRILENPAIYGARRIAEPDHAGRVKQWQKARTKWEQDGSKGDPPIKPKRTYATVEGIYPPLLSREEYERLLAVIKKRTNSPKERGRRDQVRYIGQMQTQCVCGARIGVRVVNGGYGYLFCTGRQRGETDCQRMPFKLDAVQMHLISRLRASDLATITEQSTLQAQSKVKALLAEESKLQADKALAESQHANARNALKAAIKAGKPVEIYEETVNEAQASIKQLDEALAAVMADVHAAKGDGLTDQLQKATEELLQTFVNGTDTVDERKAVNQLIQRLDLRITLDKFTNRCGLSVGDGPMYWMVINPRLDLQALNTGLSMLGSITEQFEPTPELQAMLLKEAEKQGSRVVDLGPAVIAAMEAAGEDVSQIPESARHWYVDTSDGQ